MRKLEEKYARELVVIGVHSAKFPAEKSAENIRDAVLRHDIRHPVVVDSDFAVWQSYTVRAWPTLVLVGPDGRYLGSHAGEITFEMFDPIIRQVIAEYDALGLIDRRPLTFAPERERKVDTLLSFPARVLADAKAGRLFIADSGHHRLLVVGLSSTGEGRIEAAIGSGRPGLRDGDFALASFHEPRGMALVGDVLYVADTENHAIRAVDLAAETVRTVAGTGQQSHAYPPTGGPGPQTALSSPWDVLAHDGTLYIAMAGSHQIWAMDLRTKHARPYAGTGQEALIDGPLERCALNQPSGLATDGRRLYFADSEASAVRWADLPPGGQVGTIVGTGLFDFGDVDGAGDAVRLQHPLALVYAPHGSSDGSGRLFVADTYNNKIKMIDPAARRAAPFLGTGAAGWRDGPGDEAQFDEPAGLSLAGDRLYIADTDNHLVRVADLETGFVATFQLKGLETTLPARAEMFGERELTLPEQTVAPGAGKIQVAVELPPGYKLNRDAPFYLAWAPADPAVVAVDGTDQSLAVPDPQLPMALDARFAEGETELRLDLAVYYCREGEEALCFVDRAVVGVPVRVVPGAQESTVSVAYRVKGGNA